jgi:hypothetical protein
MYITNIKMYKNKIQMYIQMNFEKSPFDISVFLSNAAIIMLIRQTADYPEFDP